MSVVLRRRPANVATFAFFVRARRSWQCLVALPLVALAGAWVAATWPGRPVAQLALLVLWPMLAAGLVGAALTWPFGETERTAARSLPRFRAAQLGSLLTMAGGSLLAATALTSWARPAGADHPELWLAASTADARWVLLRNLLWLTGLALLTARAAGAGLSWIGPLTGGLGVFAARMMLGLEMGSQRPDGFTLPSLEWAVVISPVDSRRAWFLAAATFILGAIVEVRHGARDET